MTQSSDYQKLRQARAQYEAIPVPSELSARLEETIAQHPGPAPAKQKPAARTYRWRMPAIAAACLLAVLAAFNLNPSIAQAVQDVPLLGTISRICTIQSWTQQDEAGSIIVQQPAVDGSSALAQSINAEIEQVIAECTAQAQQRQEEYREAFLATGGTEEEWAQHDLQFHVDYRICSQSDTTLSFAVTSVENWSGAYTQTWYYNIDLATHHRLTLQDLLGDDYIAIANAQIQAQMEERMAADQNVSYFDAEMGGFTTITAETPFYINQAGHPVITFEKYEIAPGFMGQQEFEIVPQ